MAAASASPRAGMAGARGAPSSGVSLTRSSTLRDSSISPGSSSSSRQRGGIFTSVKSILAHVQAKAQGHLSSAIASERAKRWAEAIDHYRRLLHSLMRNQLPVSFIPGPDYAQLLLETYYHIGVALQKQDQHQKALEEFTNAVEASHIPKYACQVGCATRSFYHTPVYARRAYANVKCGKIKEAMNDANRAVTLDNANPDVYCIRALVWSSAKETRRALVDLNYSFKLNTSHVCTLILRGAIISSLGAVSSDRNKDHEKAFKLCQDSRQFFDVLSFHSPKMPAFFDRFLWSLNAFHTIMVINLFDGAVFAVHSDYHRSSPMGESSRVTTYSEESQIKSRGPFKCGSVATYSDNTALLRRKVYSKLLMDTNPGVNVNQEKIGPRKKSGEQEATKSGLLKEGRSQKVSDNPLETLYGKRDDNFIMKSEIHRGINTAVYTHKARLLRREKQRDTKRAVSIIHEIKLCRGKRKGLTYS